MNTYVDLVNDIRTNGLTSSPRGQEVKELLFKDLRVTNSETIINSMFRNTHDYTTPEGKYLRAEFMWYMSGNLNPDYIARFGKMWDKLRNPNNDHEGVTYETKIFSGKVNSNYGYHVFWKPVTEAPIFRYQLLWSYYNSPFQYVVDSLTRDIYSRQAIIQYTLSNIYGKDIKDFTCTQNQHFLVREGKLYNLIHIRSSDAVKGLTFDIPWWDIVGQFLAKVLDVQYSDMLVHIGSAHYYERDYDLIDNLLKMGVKWDRLVLKDESTLVDNLGEVSNSIAEYFTIAYPDSKQEITRMLNFIDKQRSLGLSSDNVVSEYIIPTYLYVAQKFVSLATRYNIDTSICELYNNLFFNSVFDIELVN